MTVNELRFIILEAVRAKENSTDGTFAEVLQTEIEALMSKVEQVMEKSIDALSANKKLPKEIEEAANKLNECHSLWVIYSLPRIFPGFFIAWK